MAESRIPKLMLDIENYTGREVTKSAMRMEARVGRRESRAWIGVVSMMQDLVDFLGKLFRKLWALLSCAAFTAIGLGGLHYNKSNAWVFKASLVVAGLCFVVACFQVWRDEHTTVTALQLDFPKIRIEPLRRPWLVEREGNQLLIQLFIHTRLTNVGRAETTIHSYAFPSSMFAGRAQNWSNVRGCDPRTS